MILRDTKTSLFSSESDCHTIRGVFPVKRRPNPTCALYPPPAQARFWRIVNHPDAKSEPLRSRYIAADEIRPAVEYAGRGQFDADRWWQGSLVQPCFLL